MTFRLAAVLLVAVFVIGAGASAAELSAAEESARAVGGWDVQVSSMHHRNYVGQHVVDGDLATTTKRWVSAVGDPEPWVILIRPDAVRVDTVVVYSGFDAAAETDPYIADTYVIEYMSDGGWIEVARVTGNTNYRSSVQFPSTEANAWRIRFLVPNVHEDLASRRARVFEIRLLRPAD